MAGAELAFDGMGEGQGLGEGCGRRSVEEDDGDVAGESHGEQMEGSEMLLVKPCSWSAVELQGG